MLTRYAAHDFEFIHAQPRTCAQVLALQERGSGNPSFVDYLVMSLRRSTTPMYVFGFDATFRKNGYLLPARAVTGGSVGRQLPLRPIT